MNPAITLTLFIIISLCALININGGLYKKLALFMQFGIGLILILNAYYAIYKWEFRELSNDIYNCYYVEDKTLFNNPKIKCEIK